jgi:cytoskeletal protein CcmA (bactofilin family)
MWKRDQSAQPAGPQHDSSPTPSPTAAPGSTKPPDNLVMKLGNSISIKGELSGSEDLTLYGHMEGSIRVPEHTLTIGPDADIRAEISAKALVIMGTVTGNVTAAEKVDIRSTGTLVGDLVSPRIAIADGGSIRGKVQQTPTSAKQGGQSRS